jgi:hypothetical protein
MWRTRSPVYIGKLPCLLPGTCRSVPAAQPRIKDLPGFPEGAATSSVRNAARPDQRFNRRLGGPPLSNERERGR